MADRYEVRVNPDGRILIPVELRRSAGMEPGTTVSLRAEGGAVVVTTSEAARKRLRALFADVKQSMSEELIRERRAEAAREADPPPRPSR